MSNDCIAWFCRSTHPFQTFLVSINSRYGWFWPSLLLCNPCWQHNYHYPTQNRIGHLVTDFRHAHAYLSQLRVKCRTVTTCAPSLLGSLLLISPHKKCHFPWNVSNTRLPNQYCFSLSGIWLRCRGGNENPSPGNLHILLISISVSYLSTLTLPISSPVYGIISRCPIDQIRVASDMLLVPANSDPFKNLFWSNSSTVDWAVWKSLLT